MKKPLVLLLCITIISFASACNVDILKRVKGSGKVVSKLRNVPHFNKIKVSGTIDVFLSQGDKEEISIETDDNLHEYFETRVNNGTLEIKLSDNSNIGKVTKSNVYIKVKDLDEIKVSGACDIFGKEELKLSKLKIVSSGASDIKLKLFCNMLEISGSGAGDCEVKGKAGVLVVTSSGTFDVDAKNLIVQKAKISKSGVSDVTINVTDELEIYSTGAGDIKYYGNPAIKSIEKTGIGEVIHK